jgi:SAM-dependent methyltransferase
MSRPRVKAMAHEALAKGEPTAWFERVYQDAAGETGAVPWADLVPNPSLVDWPAMPEAIRALVVGCGLGDDAEWLAARGIEVTAFDLAPAAIAWAKKRWANTHVHYVVGDLLAPPSSWSGAFDFVFEAYTLQSLPPDLRARGSAMLGTFLATGGTLLLIARGTDVCPGIEDGPPWPLTRPEIDAAGRALVPRGFDDFLDDTGVRRFRAWFERV